jgi:hypothetical protein
MAYSEIMVMGAVMMFEYKYLYTTSRYLAAELLGYISYACALALDVPHSVLK